MVGRRGVVLGRRIQTSRTAGHGKRRSRRSSRFFARWACDYHELTHGFRAKINLHADNNELCAQEWWARELSMPLPDFTKTYIKPDGTGHRKNHLAHGVCLVRARKSADAFHRTLAWVEFMQDTLGS